MVYKGMLKKGRANEVVAVKSLKGTCVCVLLDSHYIYTSSDYKQ